MIYGKSVFFCDTVFYILPDIETAGLVQSNRLKLIKIILDPYYLTKILAL